MIVETEDLARPTSEPIEIEVISDKSRDPLEYDYRTEDAAALRDQVERDAQEALDKYSGEVDIRSTKLGGRRNGRSVGVRSVTLLYDASPLTDEGARNAIRDAAEAMRVKVIFSDELGIAGPS